MRAAYLRRLLAISVLSPRMNLNNMDVKELLRSQTFQGVIVGVTASIIALVIFQAGVFVGFRKAAFMHRFRDVEHHDGGSRGAFFDMPVRGPGKFISSDGAAGKVVSVSLPTFVVADHANVEKVVRVGGDTLIRRFDQEIRPEDIAVDEFIVVLGKPNEQSEIDAKLIRILPSPQGKEALFWKQFRL